MTEDRTNAVLRITPSARPVGFCRRVNVPVELSRLVVAGGTTIASARVSAAAS